MFRSRIPDDVVMRYVDDELPWSLRIPFRAALLLSPRLRQRIREWRLLSASLREIGPCFEVGEAKRAYGVSTAALRWVIVGGVLVALYFFGIVSRAF